MPKKTIKKPAKGKRESGRVADELDQLLEDDPFMRRLKDPNEAGALWRRLRDIEFEACKRAQALPTPANIEVADLICKARIAEERQEGLPGYITVTVGQLPRRKGPERTAAVREFVRKCKAHRAFIEAAIARPAQYPHGFSSSAEMLLLCTATLGVLTENSSARKSCGIPHVAMVQTTDFRQLNNLSQLQSLHSPGQRGIGVQ